MLPVSPTSPNPASEHQHGGFSKHKQPCGSSSGYGGPAEVSSQLKPRPPACYSGQDHRHQLTQEQKVEGPPPSLNSDRRPDYKEARAPASPLAGFGPWHGRSASPLLSTDAVATTDREEVVATTDREEVESDNSNVDLQTQKYHCMDVPRVSKGSKKWITLPLNRYISSAALENGDGLLGEAFEGTSQFYLASSTAGFLSSSNSTASNSSLCLSDLSDADAKFLLCHSGYEENASPSGSLQLSPETTPDPCCPYWE